MASNIRSRMRGRNINNISLLLDEDPNPIESSAELMDSNASNTVSSSPLSTSPSNHIATTMAFATQESASNAIRSISNSTHSRIIQRHVQVNCNMLYSNLLLSPRQNLAYQIFF